MLLVVTQLYQKKTTQQNPDCVQGQEDLAPQRIWVLLSKTYVSQNHEAKRVNKKVTTFSGKSRFIKVIALFYGRDSANLQQQTVL